MTRQPAPAGRLPRWALIAVVALPVLLVAGVLAASVVIRNQGAGPLPLTTVPAPAAASSDCAALLAALPEEIEADSGELDRRPLAEPAPVGAAAWGDPATVLRCGLERPAELTPTSRLVAVSGVQFLEIPGPGPTSYVVVDRPVYVAVTMPEGSGSAALQEVAEAVSDTLSATGLDLGR